MNRWRPTRRGPGSLELVCALILSVPSSTSAELVVMTDGQVLKVESFERREDRVLLGLRDGGQMELSIERVARILEDEIVDEPSNWGRYPVGDLRLPFGDSQVVPATPYSELIYETSRRYEVNPLLVAAMVQAESSFDPWAVSPKGAMGLLQLVPATASRFGLQPARAFDPASNLEAGVRYIKWLAERFDDDLVLVLAGYNAGEAMVERHAGVPPFRETDNYIQRVLEFADDVARGR